MKKYVLPILLFAPVFAFGQPYQAALLGHWENPDITPTSWLDSRYNDVWGTVQNGIEFAVFGSTEGVHFIDLSDPTNPTEVASVAASADGPQLVHRDYHSYNGYLYTVADEGQSTLQIIAMHNLPSDVELVYDSNEFLTRAHNIYVDSVQAVLYACGGNGGNSIRLLSLSNPEKPELLAQYTEFSSFPIPRVHDMYVRNGLAYLNCGNNGFYVVDFTTPTAPILLGSLTVYPQSGYNHSGWLADDQIHYYMCDETHGMDIKVVDVSDPSDMSVVNLFNAESTSNMIAHNAIVRDDLLYVSYYYDGLQIFDISDPANPVRHSWYDTFKDPNNSFYQGAWGVYPYLPSGIVLVSDMNNGLYIIDPFAKSYAFECPPENVEICEQDTVSFDIHINENFENPVSLDIHELPAGTIVEFSENPSFPGSDVTITLTNISGSGLFIPEITASDGVNENAETFEMDVTALTGAPNLTFPPNLGQEVSRVPSFSWGMVSGIDTYYFAIAENPNSFENSIVYDTILTETQWDWALADSLGENQTYYWQVTVVGECNTASSQIFSFTTEFTTGISELNGNTFNLYPNPVSDFLNIEFEKPLEEDIRIELLTLNGIQLIENQMFKSITSTALDLNDLNSGVYFLKLISEDKVLTKKILIQ